MQFLRRTFYLHRVILHPLSSGISVTAVRCHADRMDTGPVNAWHLLRARLAPGTRVHVVCDQESTVSFVLCHGKVFDFLVFTLR